MAMLLTMRRAGGSLPYLLCLSPLSTGAVHGGLFFSTFLPIQIN
jgi:hypothetical protein